MFSVRVPQTDGHRAGSSNLDNNAPRQTARSAGRSGHPGLIRSLPPDARFGEHTGESDHNAEKGPLQKGHGQAENGGQWIFGDAAIREISFRKPRFLNVEPTAVQFFRRPYSQLELRCRFDAGRHASSGNIVSVHPERRITSADCSFLSARRSRSSEIRKRAILALGSTKPSPMRS